MFVVVVGVVFGFFVVDDVVGVVVLFVVFEVYCVFVVLDVDVFVGLCDDVCVGDVCYCVFFEFDDDGGLVVEYLFVVVEVDVGVDVGWGEFGCLEDGVDDVCVDV